MLVDPPKKFISVQFVFSDAYIGECNGRKDLEAWHGDIRTGFAASEDCDRITFLQRTPMVFRYRCVTAMATRISVPVSFHDALD